ncbi:MAG: AAA family ATPase, partial [Lachnospiraceae bacterium]|nr:AAA family ATPase [Lachnospiraceae bacterium]
MGVYLNPGNENFRRTLASGKYVDKTGMISVMNEFIDRGNNYVCVSRPRRFGKTVAQNMLCAYYSKGCDSKELFAPYKIASDPDFTDPEGRRNHMNVIKLDMNSEYQAARSKEQLIFRVEEKIKREMRQEFPNVEITEEDSLAEAIRAVYSVTNETFIILIDEYDVLVREQVSEDLFA